MCGMLANLPDLSPNDDALLDRMASRGMVVRVTFGTIVRAARQIRIGRNQGIKSIRHTPERMSHFNMMILNQYLIILYFLVGGQHFSTFHSSHIACCYSNFSCTDRMERVGLYPKSIRWSRIFDVLYSGILS